jgi:flagellar hook-associated protein 3 FlgL
MITGSFYGTSRAGRNSGSIMTELRATLVDLQRQLGTGEKSESYGGLGVARRVSLDANARLTRIKGYTDVIANADMRIKMMNQSLQGLSDIIGDARSAALADAYEPNVAGRTVAQTAADDQIKMAIDLLNVDAGGRHLFSGRSTDVMPIANYNEIMNGSGARVGVKQMIAERLAADQGSGGLGRLASASLAGSTVTLQRDAANPGPFGFMISGISSGLSNVAVAGPAGATQAVTANFTGQPNNGERVTVTLTLPDGSQQELSFTASTTPPTPIPAGTFAIGATAAATAANFQSALQAAVQKAAVTSLVSTSAIAAANAFFAGTTASPPMRVPSPAATATALAAGTSANTVIWYRGDADTAAFPNARTTALANAGEALSAGVGARANEQGLRQTFAMLATMSAVNVAPADPDGKARYDDLRIRVAEGLSFPSGMQSVSAIQTELATASSTLATAKERHTAMSSLLRDTVDAVQKVDPQDVGAAILSLQTRLEATYATTATLAKLSLVQYLS